MKKLNYHLVGVDQGSIVLFSDFEHGGPMWTGEGARTTRKAVTFSERYRDPPMVHVSISMWDMDQDKNQRADIAADNVTSDGFDLVFRTWGDSRVARIRADWLSFGEITNDDAWDLY